MKLQFDTTQVVSLAQQYEEGMGDRDRRLTEEIIHRVFPSYEAKGFLTKKEFLAVCQWKTPRTKPHCESNDEQMIRDVSALVRTTESEPLRIQAWTLLSGVKWSTASVFLHFGFKELYPILDFRALFSLGEAEPAYYDFNFWWKYVICCRSLAAEVGVTMRTLDQALWQYSKLHQRPVTAKKIKDQRGG